MRLDLVDDRRDRDITPCQHRSVAGGTQVHLRAAQLDVLPRLERQVAGGAYLADLVGDAAVVLPAAVDVGDIGAAGLDGVEGNVRLNETREASPQIERKYV